jgi:hypothetical protein
MYEKVLSPYEKVVQLWIGDNAMSYVECEQIHTVRLRDDFWEFLMYDGSIITEQRVTIIYGPREEPQQ